MSNKKLLGAAAIAASLAGGGIAGAVFGTPTLGFAQESTTTTTTIAPDTTDPSTPEGTDETRPERGGGPCGGHVGASLDAAAEALGVTADELRDALRDGKSIADVAGEKGVDVQTVIDALVADATAKIDEKVASGDLDADRAAELKENLVERITDMVNHEGGFRGPGGPGFGRGPIGARLDTAAEALGITADELRDALQDGKSIADVAGEKGVDVQAVIDALVADATAKIDEKVASGDLDADRAAELKENLVEHITDMVNHEGGLRGPGPGGPRFEIGGPTA